MHTVPQDSSNIPSPAAYSPLRPPGLIDLHLDANEALVPSVDVAAIAAALGTSATSRYPSASVLATAIALRLGVQPSRVIVTAGGDEGIDRACRAFLRPGAELILPVPTFEMIERYANLAGAQVIPVPWRQGPFPVKAVLDQVNPRTAMIAIVSPNNPTGSVAQAQDLEKLSASAPHAQLLIDLAYEEFAQNPLTSAALALPNTITIRTFSKAFGLAGLRVGYAVASESAVGALRVAGSPFSVSAISIAAAQTALELSRSWLDESVNRVRDERARLRELLLELGASPFDSQGNFVLAQFSDARWVWRALAGLGIAVRRFAGADLQNYLRTTCPGHEQSFTRLQSALRSAIRPSIVIVTSDCLQGSDIECLKRLSKRIPLALIFDRPRAEYAPAVDTQSVFSSVVFAEDFPSSAEAIQAVQCQQRIPHGWMLCVSLQSIANARAAGLVPLALASDTLGAWELERVGASRVLNNLAQLEGMLP